MYLTTEGRLRSKSSNTEVVYGDLRRASKNKENSRHEEEEKQVKAIRKMTDDILIHETNKQNNEDDLLDNL